MDNDCKIIDIKARREEPDANTDEYEDWEDDHRLISKGDYRGLKKLRERKAKNDPSDIDALWRLGEAYILCKEYKKAIEYFTLIHRKHPDNCNITYSILDALFALGHSERDFNWISVPKVIRLNKEVADLCYDFLKGKRKARELDDIFCQLIMEGYIIFKEIEFLDYLIEDGRFEVQKDPCVNCSLLRVQMHKKNKNSLLKN